MSLKNILIVVSDLERSKKFYQDFFGLQVMKDFGENIILSEGLVLQEKVCWQELIGAEVVVGNASELFFVEDDLDAFLMKIEEYMAESHQKVSARENSWGKRVLMLRDPDGHVIEVAER